MARTKKTDQDIYSELASISGGRLLGNEPPVNYYIDSGNLVVNYLMSGSFIGGGYPGGRIIEMVGPPAGGKSHWGCSFARGLQLIDGIPVYLDAENALNPLFAARASHLDPYKLVHIRPRDGIDCLERAFLKVHNVIRGFRAKNPTQPLGFVYDSISVSPSERELRETNISEKFTQAEWKRVVGAHEQPGERAKICNKEFRKLESVLERTDTTMLVINQLRKNIGVRYGALEKSSTASDVLEYYSCMRMRVSAHKKIENKLGRVIGINLKVRNIKNRINAPFMEAEGIHLFYEKGVNPLSGLLSLLEQIERIESVGKGMYKVKEPWADGQDVTFKGSKTSNLLDADVLYKCPKLVDAKDEDQVKEYLSVYVDAINLSLGEDAVEKDISDEFEEEGESEE